MSKNISKEKQEQLVGALKGRFPLIWANPPKFCSYCGAPMELVADIDVGNYFLRVECPNGRKLSKRMFIRWLIGGNDPHLSQFVGVIELDMFDTQTGEQR